MGGISNASGPHLNYDHLGPFTNGATNYEYHYGISSVLNETVLDETNPDRVKPHDSSTF